MNEKAICTSAVEKCKVAKSSFRISQTACKIFLEYGKQANKNCKVVEIIIITIPIYWKKHPITVLPKQELTIVHFLQWIESIILFGQILHKNNSHINAR